MEQIGFWRNIEVLQVLSKDFNGTNRFWRNIEVLQILSKDFNETNRFWRNMEVSKFHSPLRWPT
jgi:hypothetical protein